MTEVEFLKSEIERYRRALTYIRQPSMAYSGGGDTEVFARDEATASNARIALTSCIAIARQTLCETCMGQGAVEVPDEVQGVRVSLCWDCRTYPAGIDL